MLTFFTENRTWSIWQKRPRKNMTLEEVKKFELEGQYSFKYFFYSADVVLNAENRVQFARAEAEFHRWLEQVELKHAEIERVFNYYKKMVLVWTQLAERVEKIVGPSAAPRERAKAAGQAAYARRTAHEVWAGLAQRMDLRLKGLGILELRARPAGKTLPDQIRVWRSKQALNYFPDYK
jgi:hypothetical protein